ncbi:protein RFT1 homolog [Diaphorina citri]|uniref:Protein RFT1 homolog n=1 Tax=Diaphorina citri TaxID=121845 RepID=A0A3Q0JG53_DIACI|nr:protein RFT1 homolog [Diaphorina citri]
MLDTVKFLSFAEAYRVERFLSVCRSDISEEQKLQQLGTLMNQSHTSLATKYECSHEALDSLVTCFREAGAYGARLTGAGVPICSVLCVLFGFIWLHVLTIPDPSVTTHYAVGVWSIAISCVMEMCCEPCSVLCVLFGFIWLHVLTIPDPSVTTHYAVGVWSIAISCVMEMCCEPLYLVAQAFLFIRLRVVCESVIVGVRTATFTLLVFTWASPGAVLAFSIAQLLSIGAYMVSLYAYFWWYLRQRAAITREAGQASRETLDGKETPNVGRNETPDGKETTTENETPSRGRNETASGVNETPDGGGKRVPLERKQSLEEEFPFRAMTDFLPKRLENEWIPHLQTPQQSYIKINMKKRNFLKGSLQDASYNIMLQLLLTVNLTNNCHLFQTSMKEAARVLEQVLRCVTSLGLVVLVFGQSYSRLLLLLYGGSSLADGGLAPLLLRVHCLAVLFLAVNGTTECYALATMDTYQIDR